MCYYKTMMMKLIIVTCCCMVAMATSDAGESSRPVPPSCYVLPSSGTGRATHPRFRFNAATNQCERFRWTGGVAEENNFQTRRECEATCKRDDEVEARDTPLTCEFSSNLNRVCSFENIFGPDDISLCLNQEIANITRDQCVSFGCCWHLGFCFQKTSDLVRSSCVIQQSTRTRFWGKVVFQADANSEDWLGSIRFNSLITGDFCILDSGVDYVEIEREPGSDRQRFTLPSRRGIVSGEQISILFRGRFDQAPLDSSPCSAISRWRISAAPGK